MNLPITRALVTISLASFVFVIGGLASLLYVLFQDRRESYAIDSVLVISMMVAELHQKGAAPTQAQIEDNIRVLVNASVINAGLDRLQRPVDVYGTPFRVRHTIEGALHRATATSAGPDRRFDTPDDISREATWETPAPPSKQ